MNTKPTCGLVACCFSVLIVGLAGLTVHPKDAVAAAGRGQTTSSSRPTGGESIETPALRFSISPRNGQYEILDKQSKVEWDSNPFHQRLGEVTLNAAGQKPSFSLDRPEIRRVDSGLELTFHPLIKQSAAWVRVLVRPIDNGNTLEFSYASSPDLPVESIRLLDQAFWVTDQERGYIVVPTRMGQLLPADSGKAFQETFDTYANEGCDMEMLGVVKRGAALLVTWDDPYVEAEIRSTLPSAGPLAGRQVLAASLAMRRSAKSFRLHFEGPGDYTTIAKAYRKVAAERGWLVTWKEKLQGHPERALLFGAVDFRVGTLRRRMNAASTQELSVEIEETFPEAAQIAEHLKNDLHLDKVLFLVSAWIRRGYDNQHPDILPAAPECGGDRGLADLSRRVMRLGYLLSLHDNYQDIYRDSPSWNEGLIMKNPDGSLARGGVWMGGQAYLICSQMGLELAERPQNLPAVKALTEANSYFIDTTFAAPLMECSDPRHPLRRQDDMHWKQALADYARKMFGIFGSEDGDEWAIPHSDYFEGLVGVRGQYFWDAKFQQEFAGTEIPLFELVYRDTIALYAKYGYDIFQAADFVLYHLSIGRPLIYSPIPAHLYWREATPIAQPPHGVTRNSPQDGALFTRADHGWAEGLPPLDRFIKNTYEILSPLNELTAQMEMTQHRFLTPDRKVQLSVFGEGAEAVQVVVNASSRDYRCASRDSGTVVLPPYGFLVESPTFVAFHARNWADLSYADPPLFTLRSLDGKPLNHSSQIRLYHGFGDPRIRVGPTTRRVEKDAVVSSASGNL